MSRRGLAATEAEALIAELWRALEEHGIASPRLRVLPVGDALELQIEFLSEEDAALMRQVVEMTPLDQPARSRRTLVQASTRARDAIRRR